MCKTKAPDIGSPADGAGGLVRPVAGVRSVGATSRSSSVSPTRSVVSTAVPTGANAAASGSSVSWNKAVPLATNGPSLLTWYVKTGAPSTTTTSWPSSCFASCRRAGVRKPANAGWSSGKLQRPLRGLTHTAAPVSSASSTVRSHAPSRSTPAPTTSAGRVLRFNAAAAAAKPTGSPTYSLCTSRGATRSPGASQSSSGIETNVGPQGGCIAT